MVILNLSLPIFSFSFILNVTKGSELNICLGKGYLNFLTSKAQMCSWENSYTNGICWVWLIILSIGNSKFQINTLARNVWVKWTLLITFSAQTPLSWDVPGQNHFRKRNHKTGKGHSKTGNWLLKQDRMFEKQERTF